MVSWALLGIYLLSLASMFCQIENVAPTSERAALFVCGTPVWHSAMFRDAVERALGADWAWYLQSWVAMQQLLGFVFQPSLFGVLLVASLAAFLRGWAWRMKGTRLGASWLCLIVVAVSLTLDLLRG